jgi:hypothetical protein
LKNLLAILLCLPFFNANAQDSASHKSSWHMIYSLGFNYNQVGGSMPDFIEKFSREFGTPMPRQNDGGGIQLGVFVQKDISEFLYLKSGFGLTFKNVNPEEQAYPLYKDSLKTDYISIPLLIGVQTSLNEKKNIDFFFETGILTNFAIGDKSYKAPDRVAFSHSTVVATYQIINTIPVRCLLV